MSVCRTHLWDVPPMDKSNKDTGGWPMLGSNAQVEVWNGVSRGRTYSHHPIIEVFDGTIIVMWSSGKVDEDSNGQSVYGAISTDEGETWSTPELFIPGALLPDQIDEKTFEYWNSRHIAQRAWQPVAFVQSSETGVIYAVAVSTCFQSNNEKGWQNSGGRITRPIDIKTGSPAGIPTWLNQNRLTCTTLQYQDTLYGKTYGMKYCDEKDLLIRTLDLPQNVPAWSTALYNHDYFAEDHAHVLGEVTRAVWDVSAGKWQRFWRDESPKDNTWHVWTESTSDPSKWYPHDLTVEGNPEEGTDMSHDIHLTDIPDAKTKQYFGFFTTRTGGKRRYLVSNPRPYDARLHRYPLTLAWEGVNDDERLWTFKNIGVLRTYPRRTIAKETREDYKNPGFSYPSAAQFGNNLLIAYSENKENIWISSIPISSLS